MGELEAQAREAMDSLCPELTESFVAVVEFSQDNPDLAVKQRKTKARPNPSVTDPEHFEFLANKFYRGHQKGTIPQPGTVPDPALAIVMRHGYSFVEQDLDEMIEGHRIAMVAENMIGELLERYLDSVLDNDWIWCAGEVVKSVDFIRRSPTDPNHWDALQIKNRDNSENSSSASVRNGTEIKKWCRSKSRTGLTNWENFPIDAAKKRLSEDRFQRFVVDYLDELVGK